MTSDLLRQSLRLAIASFLTAAIAIRFNTIAYAWYPLTAVVVVVDDNTDQSLKAAFSRIIGTILGGLITFLVHSVLGGWIGVLVSLLLMVPVLRVLGLQSSLGTAALVSLMFLMIPKHEELNWDYLFQRSLDTGIGCAIAIGGGLVLWPRNGTQELLSMEAGLRSTLKTQSQAHRQWLQGLANRPEPHRPEPLAATLQTMEHLVARELRGPHARQLQQQRWRQRLRLWDRVQHHWCAWENLLLYLPGLEHQSAPTDPSTPDPLASAIAAVQSLLAGTPAKPPSPGPSRWQALALHRQLPLLMLLAFAEEQRPLAASLNTLRLLAPCR